MQRETPKQVRRAVYLLWASLLVGILSVAFEWESIRRDLGEFEVMMLAIFAFSFAFPALLIYFVSRGHNWARIISLLLTIGGIAFYLGWPAEGPQEPWWSIALTVMITAMDLTAIYWLFTGDGARWFQERRSGAF